MAVFPQDSGLFDTGAMVGGHYEVNGEATTTATQPPAATYTPQQTAMPAASQQGRFLFAVRQTAPPPPFRRPVVRAFPRAVQLVEANMHHVQTLYLRLTEAECNVASVSEMVQQQLDCQEAVILVDCKGMEITESPGTHGSDFWKPQTRKILCMTETAHREFQSGWTRKQRRTDTDNVQAPPEQAALLKIMHDMLRTVETATQEHMLLKAKKSDLAELKASFECCICKGVLHQLMFSLCCKSLLACQQCLEHWITVSGICPRCQVERIEQASIKVTGLDDTIKAVKSISEADM